MSLLRKSAPTEPASAQNASKMRLFQQVKTAKSSLWLILAFSVVNLFLFAFSGTYFVFSAEFPLFLMGLLQEIAAVAAEEGTDLSVLIPASYVISALLLVPYLALALSAKKHRGAVIAAAVLWTVDSAFCLILMLGDLSMFLDVVLHVIGIVELFNGASAMKKLQNMPEEVPVAEFTEPVQEEVQTPTDDFNQGF